MELDVVDLAEQRRLALLNDDPVCESKSESGDYACSRLADHGWLHVAMTDVNLIDARLPEGVVVIVAVWT
jgi:hypothetical protein